MKSLLQRLLLCVATTMPCILFSQATAHQVSNTSNNEATAKSATSFKVERLGDHINTENADLAPCRYADKLYFTSTVKDEKEDKILNRVFTALPDQNAQVFDGNPENSRTHMANTAVTITGDRMYFTLYKGNVDQDRISKIWFRERDYDGNWSQLKHISEPVNVSGQQNKMPATGIFRDTREDILFFVSDREGGKGGLDIWYTVVNDDGTFGEPVNLPFNTPEDDVTPYFNISDQTLYFSSNGKDGEGGFDIYKVAKVQGHDWGEVRNLGAEVNSAYDELYFTFHEGSNSAYFSSDRPAEDCDPAVNSCRNFDIYQLKVIGKETFSYSLLND